MYTKAESNQFYDSFTWHLPAYGDRPFSAYSIMRLMMNCHSAFCPLGYIVFSGARRCNGAQVVMIVSVNYF